MDAKLDDIRLTLAKMPTVAGLLGMVATVIGVALTMLGLVVAVLTWLQGIHPSH